MSLLYEAYAAETPRLVATLGCTTISSTSKATSSFCFKDAYNLLFLWTKYAILKPCRITT
jgi:hypothetical protein